ncbi:MAG: ATP-grasp domain-containing protein [Methermicoccaceae archaeon]
MSEYSVDELVRHMTLLNDERNSLLYWYPIVKNIAKTPETVWVKVDYDFGLLERIPDNIIEELKSKVREVNGYPVFMRTDTFSGKHGYLDTCYVPSEDKLERNLHILIDMSFAHDLFFRAICLREFIELDWRFKAFLGLPIAPEVRVMIRDNIVERWFFYWVKDAIRRPDREDWERLHEEMVRIAREEQDKFLRVAERVARKFDGYWSVDFARGRDGEWYLIDMALGEVSWTPEVEGVTR